MSTPSLLPSTTLTKTSSSKDINTTPSRIKYLDKYLELPTSKRKTLHPASASSKMRAITGARVLTSSECLSIIKEREAQKKKEEEEKERRRREREEKKTQKAEEKKKKEEEKKRKEERRRKVEEKAEEIKQRGREREKTVQ